MLAAGKLILKSQNAKVQLEWLSKHSSVHKFTNNKITFRRTPATIAKTSRQFGTTPSTTLSAAHPADRR